MSLLEFALEYALNWLVLPLAWITKEGVCGCQLCAACTRPGKHPITRNGVNDATADPETIKRLWGKWPIANIGNCTGQQSGLVVLDVDPRNGGNESLARLISQYGELPKTPLCATGGGGWHYYFQYPGAVQLKGAIPGFHGLDIKGDGGYVVAPPSIHLSGKAYQWLNNWRTTPLAPVPDWVLQLIRRQDQCKAQTMGTGKVKASLPTWALAKLSPEDRDILSRLEQGLVGNRYQLLLNGDWQGLYSTQSFDEAWHHERPEVRNPDRHWYEQIHCRGGALISLYDHDPAPIFRVYTPMVKSARAVFNHIRNIPGVWADFHYSAEAVIYFPAELLEQVA